MKEAHEEKTFIRKDDFRKDISANFYLLFEVDSRVLEQEPVSTMVDKALTVVLLGLEVGALVEQYLLEGQVWYSGALSSFKIIGSLQKVSSHGQLFLIINLFISFD